MATYTARQDLLAMIAMSKDAIATCEREGEMELLAMHHEILARREAALAAMGDSDGDVFNVPAGEGEKARLTDRPAAGSAASNQFGTFQVNFASAKQTGFIKSLLERKDLSPLADSVTIDVARLREQVAKQQVNKKAASAIIDRLLALPDLAPVASAMPEFVSNPASDKQIGLIGRLADDRDWVGCDSEASETIMNVIDGKQVSKREASAAIDALLAAPKTKAPVATVALEAGMYRVPSAEFGGTLVRVYYGRQSGQMLAKKVVGNPEDGYTFDYMGKADRFVTAAQRLSLDEAKAWGRMTGTCCVCAAHLDDPNSVEAGIGPVCASRV